MAKGLFDCTGKVTMVTGGNSGIGLGFAMGPAKMGGDIAVWARNAEKNAKAKEQLLAAGAGRVETYQVDVSSEAAVIEGYKQLRADFGRVDCIFANSGRSAKGGPFIEMDSEEWHDLLNTSMHGAFYTLREGAKMMVERAEAGEPGGSLVFCGSLSMIQGITNIANYQASKGAMGAVMRGLAVELGKYGIRANTVAPGYIKTGMMDGAPEGVAEKIDAFFASKTPISRPGYPDDFEGIGAYLCSDASKFHSGDLIVIDGASSVTPVYASAIGG